MTPTKTFEQLKVVQPLLTALTELEHKTPTPIQEESIPVLLDGCDLLAQAQTGTGKTAAFALPILSQIDLSLNKPQTIVITPTRELAIQVAQAFQSYAKHLKNFRVLPIYGGQSYHIQLTALKRGAHVIVGTPGRVMDHLRRGTLCVSSIKTVVLDEADEMLRMGFIKDVEWILSQMQQPHQTALFSATMPAPIHKIANRYLKNAKKIHIQNKENSADNIEQFYMTIPGHQKFKALTRLLEAEEIQAAIIFTRTKSATVEIAEKMSSHGYAVAALNGDMNQSVRERVLTQMKRGSLTFIVATDVAARGIDVERMSHVINYDIPHDAESYIHRIGRTGRAGRKGKAFLFVTMNERRIIRDIERATRATLSKVEPPSLEMIQAKRSKTLALKIAGIIEKDKGLKPYRELVETISKENQIEIQDIAVALACLMEKSKPVLGSDESMNSASTPKPKPTLRMRRNFSDNSGRAKNRFKRNRSTH